MLSTSHIELFICLLFRGGQGGVKLQLFVFEAAEIGLLCGGCEGNEMRLERQSGRVVERDVMLIG